MTENFQLFNIGNNPRVELHDRLGLTGCEASVNCLPAGAAVPFVHKHTHNEELYGVISGRGEIWIDGQVSEIKTGDWFRVSPKAKRAIRAGDEPLIFICVQAKEDSLEGFTMSDAVICEDKAPWME